MRRRTRNAAKLRSRPPKKKSGKDRRRRSMVRCRGLLCRALLAEGGLETRAASSGSSAAGRPRERALDCHCRLEGCSWPESDIAVIDPPPCPGLRSLSPSARGLHRLYAASTQIGAREAALHTIGSPCFREGSSSRQRSKRTVKPQSSGSSWSIRRVDLVMVGRGPKPTGRCAQRPAR